MGISPDLLDRLVDWGVKSGQHVLDIGTSELFCASDPEALNRLVTHFDGQPFDDRELARIANRAFARELFERAGLQYEAIDISPYPGTIVIDLNRGALPFWKRGRFDLVMNCGTTEHVVNQLNAFQLIHDACKVGGLMYHGVPMAGDFSHGFFGYHPKLFTRMQEANGYEIVDRWIWASDEVRSYDEVELAPFNRPFGAQDAFVNFVLRRRHKAPFRIPGDCIDWSPTT